MYPENPDFRELAGELRAAKAALSRAANVAAVKLYRPEINFSRAIRLLESMAQYVDRQLLWLAYVKHNALTEAPAHRRNAAKQRAGECSSEAKRIAARRNGRAGGRSKSWLKQQAAVQNGKLGGRPRRKNSEPTTQQGQ